MRHSGSIVGVWDHKGYLYPAFQFDVANRRIWPVVVQVNQVLGAASDPWGVASWWISENPRLNGASPLALTGADRDEDLFALARSL